MDCRWKTRKEVQGSRDQRNVRNVEVIQQAVRNDDLAGEQNNEIHHQYKTLRKIK